jgi:hypothetical protein
MSSDRKLRLVPPVVDRDDRGLSEDELAPSAREIAEAEELRALLERGDDPLVSALRAAYVPARLDAIDHDALIDRALGLGVMDAPASPVERASAERLREATMHPRSDDRDEPLVEVFDALEAAYRPRSIDPLRNELLISRALKRSSERTTGRRVLPIVTAAVLGVTAMAAGFALYFRTGPDKPVAVAPSLQRSRSAADLFDAATPFPRAGGESARVDRITTVRATELRNNRFAMWGVR